MSLKHPSTFDLRAGRGRSMRRRALALAPALAALLGVAPALAAAPGDGATTRRTAGDGRGLTTFGDRGITSFGTRFDASFSRRALTTFSDTPLAPMGGLIRGGVPAPAGSDSGSSRSRGSSGNTTTLGFPAGGGGITSEATLRVDSGAYFGDDDYGGGALLMPAVELPTIVLDHRPAAEVLDATLDAAIRVATESGDFDLARSLDPDRR